MNSLHAKDLILVCNLGSFTYYVINKGEGGGLQMITLLVFVTNNTTVKRITMGRGFEIGQKLIT